MKTLRTPSVSLAGAICGPVWWPNGFVAGSPLNQSARGPWGFWQDGDSFRDALIVVTREVRAGRCPSGVETHLRAALAQAQALQP